MKSEDQVRVAIEQCLQECCRAPTPVVKLEECIESLRAEGWEAPDVRLVEGPVLRMLAKLLSPKNDPNEPEQSELE